MVGTKPRRELHVRIGKPSPAPTELGGFYCPIEMTGFRADKPTAIFGVDAFQAIELALRFVCYRVTSINDEHGGRLRWEDGELPKEWAQKDSM